MNPQRIKSKINGVDIYSTKFENEEDFYLLFSKSLIEMGIYKPEWGFDTSFENIVPIVKNTQGFTWSDGKEFQKKILLLIENNIPQRGAEPEIKDIEIMKEYWREYGPLYTVDDIENKTEIIKHFIGTCYTTAFMIRAWNPNLFKNVRTSNDFEIANQILASVDLQDTTDNILQDFKKYYIYLSLWDDEGLFNPIWKSLTRIPWAILIKNYENGLDEILELLDDISLETKATFLSHKQIMDEKRWHSQKENDKWYELLEIAEVEYCAKRIDNLIHRQSFFPIMIPIRKNELNRLADYLSNDDIDSYTSWLKTVYLNSISGIIALHPARIITSMENGKISFFPQIDNNIIYFLTTVIEQSSAANYCKYCGKELIQSTGGGRPARFCKGERCYDKFTYHHQELRREQKKINSYIHSILKNRQGKKIDLELKEQLRKEANQQLVENKSYDIVLKYVKRILNEKYPLKKY